MTTAEQLRREGMIEGRIEGKAERNVEIVKNALQMGLHRNQIKQLTGLSSAEINEIAQDIKDN